MISFSLNGADGAMSEQEALAALQENPQPLIKEIEGEIQQAAMFGDMLKNKILSGRLNKAFCTSMLGFSANALFRITRTGMCNNYLTGTWFSLPGMIAVTLGLLLSGRELYAAYGDYRQLKMVREQQELYMQHLQEVRMFARSAKKQ